MEDEREQFDKAWANRPWIVEDESDKDRAWRWWKAGFDAGLQDFDKHEKEYEAGAARLRKAIQNGDI